MNDDIIRNNSNLSQKYVNDLNKKLFNLDEKMTKTHFKKCFRGKLGVDLDKAWKIIQEAKKKK